MSNLKKAKVGSLVKVVKVNGQGALRRRIMDMGITKGVEIKVVKYAPLGDPMELVVRGYSLSLRKNDAASIDVVEV
ncbi:MAG: ferrous iron transport protein A [Anaerorhabdus sp.]